MSFLEEKIEPYIEQKKNSNKLRYGTEFITYDPEQLKFNLGESNGYSDKVLRIPSACFITIEYCHSLKNGKNQAEGYELATYTPCELPFSLKCCAFFSLQDDEEFHRHDYFEMIYVYKGYRTMMIENQKITLNENDICIFDMQCAHLDLRSESDGIAVYCGFTRCQIDKYFLNNLKNHQVRKFFIAKDEKTEDVRYIIAEISAETSEEILKLFGQIAEELERVREGNEYITKIYLLRIINHIKSRDEEIYVYGKKLKGSKLFQAVAKYIYSNVSTVDIQILCRVFHYQEDYYNRLIKKNTGLTYSEYIQEMRLDRAKNLLINTELSVKNIMEYLGYSSHTFFYRRFKEKTGFTPLEYRRHYRK